MTGGVVLVVLDGWGLAPPGPGNAVDLADTPVFDDLWARYPHATLTASGLAVGLPEGQFALAQAAIYLSLAPKSDSAKKAIGAAREHVREHGVSLSINLSGRSVGDPSLPAYLEDAVRAAKVDPSRLVFEVTETAAIAHMGHAQRLARRLRALGCRFALDDFGEGQSSLRHLRQLEVDELKVDRQFVLGMADDARDSAIVAATVDLGHRLGYHVVAEGVEDEVTWRRLQELGCDTAQGYWIGRPLDAPAFERWLADWRPAEVRALRAVV